jgi:hypothetical protein
VVRSPAILEELAPDRQPAEEVTRGLETTSAKISALAQAGYDRTEIADNSASDISTSAKSWLTQASPQVSGDRCKPKASRSL